MLNRDNCIASLVLVSCLLVFISLYLQTWTSKYPKTGVLIGVIAAITLALAIVVGDHLLVSHAVYEWPDYSGATKRKQ